MFRLMVLLTFCAAPLWAAFPDICSRCWYEVPDSKLRQVVPDPGPPGSGGPNRLMGWSGAAFDSRRSRLILAGGGGGADNSGNDVYAFDLDSLKWFRIKAGATVYDDSDAVSPYFFNGGAEPDSQQPRPGYSYDQIEYDSLSDNVYLFGLPFAASQGSGWKNILALNLGTLTWSSPAELGQYCSGGTISGVDPDSGRIWVFPNGGTGGSFMGHFQPGSNTWTPRGNVWSDFPIATNQNAAYMPSTHRIISVGVGLAEYWDTRDTGDVVQHELVTTGCDSLLAKDAPGFEWFPPGRKMVGWAGGTRVYTMDSTYTCTEVAANDSNTVTPDAPIDVGTYGRWRYVPKYNVFVVVNATDSSVWLYRPGEGSSAPPAPPVVVITSPSQDTTVNASSILVRYTVDGILDSSTFALSPGNNELIVSSTNAGGTGRDTIYVARGNPGSSDPTWPSGATLTASEIMPSSLKLTWSAADDDSAVTNYQVYVDGVMVYRLPASPRNYVVTGLLVGQSYEFRVEALDLRNNISIDGPVRHFSTADWLPPDPASVAPPLPYGQVSTMADAATFLFKGGSPIQTGVIDSLIDSLRIAILRGRALDTAGGPLPGITVTINGQSGFGSTVTREDGMFDMVVNGGGKLSLQFAAQGYLPVQRDVFPRWQAYTLVPDVSMIRLDTMVTPIPLSSGSVQVARGSVVSDSDGTRRATLLIPTSTSLTITLPGGGILTPDSMHVRATEFTVGTRGPARMPATLPSTSGYTYAVEYSLDGAPLTSSMVFNQPIYSYTENFLHIPVGSPVPSAHYDRDKSVWVPSEDGRVIKIAGITSGKADLVVDTGGSTASDAHLDSIGIYDSERVALASLYSGGQELWRVPIRHFSIHDYNFPVNLPPGATSPVAKGSNGDKSTPKTDCAQGSVIDCQNQVLGESVHFPGMPGLVYRTDRVYSRRWNMLDIPVTGPSLPASVVGISLDVQIAGRKFHFDHAPGVNIRDTVDWDGMDAYGRVLRGKQPYSATISYAYPVDYAPPRIVPKNGSSLSLDSTASSFGFPSGKAFEDSVPARSKYVLSDTYSGYVGASEVNDIGPGWSLENHHAYDPLSGSLNMGTGEIRSIEGGVGAIYTVAGGGSATPGSIGSDGVPGKAADVGTVNAMNFTPDGSLLIADRAWRTVWKLKKNGKIVPLVTGAGITWYDAAPAPDGSVYLTDQIHHKIWKREISGALSVFAGNGTGGFGGDGGPATGAALNAPNNVVVGPDGSVFISDRGNLRVRKVSPDGIIQTVAGTGSSTYNGDSIPATEANMSVNHIAVGGDGSIYINDSFNPGIRKVDASGIITRVAGNYESGTAGDGGPALEAQITADRIAVVNTARGGTLIYISDELNNTIRVIDEKGIINRIAGGGTDESKDGIAGTKANLLEARGLAVDPTGNVYVGRFVLSGKTVRKIVAKLPEYRNEDILIPDPEAGLVYEFSAEGRHLRTLNALTAATLLSFEYDGAKRLSGIVDAFGNTTQIQRGVDGFADALVNPYGKTLTLQTDGEGRVTDVVLPSSETHVFSYDSVGLMATYTTPGGHEHSFTYDAFGRLILDEDPAGGAKALAKTDTAGGWKATLTTALGRANQYSLDFKDDLSIAKRTVDPSGLVSTTSWSVGGMVTSQSPDSVLTTLESAPDPQFGFQGLSMTSRIRRLPSGLADTMVISPGVAFADPDNPLSLKTLGYTATINGGTGGTTISKYIDSLGVIVNSYPSGRVDSIYIDTLGRAIAKKSTKLERIHYSYDSRGRLDTLRQGDGDSARIMIYSYHASGYLAQVEDAENRVHRFDYDSSGRVDREILPDGSEIDYAYDPDGNILSIGPPGRPEHEFEYSPIGLEARYAPPPLGAGAFDTHTAYSLDRQLLNVTRPDSLEIEYVYDDGGRLDSVKTANGVYLAHYSSVTGRLDSLRSPSGISTHYVFDGPLLRSLEWSGGLQGKISTVYDHDFRMVSRKINDTDEIVFQHFPDGRLSQAGDMYMYWDSLGRWAEAFVNLMAEYSTYSSFGDLAEYQAFGFFDEETIDTVYTCSFAQDRLGRITQKTERIQGLTRTYRYAYDLAGRLDSVWVDAVLRSAYAYDSNGNRQVRTHPGGADTGTYDDQDRLLSYAGTTYAYSRNGDLQAKVSGTDTTRYRYDVLGNLLGVKLPTGDSLSYLIDGQNRRVGKQVNGTLVQGLLYQNQLNPVAELDGAGNVVSRFVYGSKPNVPDQILKGDTVYRVISDHLGSPRLVIDSWTGQVVQRMDYDEFGNVLYDSHPGFQPFGFAGGLHDPQAKLVRFGARDYSPEIGRWISKDPIGFNGGSANLYVYVANDPVNLVDPLGLTPGGVAIGAGVGGVVGGVIGGVVGGGGGTLVLPGGGTVGGGYAGAMEGTAIGAAVGGVIGGLVSDIYEDWPWWDENVGPRPISPKIPTPKDICIEECSRKLLMKGPRDNCGQGHDFSQCVEDCIQEKLGL